MIATAWQFLCDRGLVADDRRLPFAAMQLAGILAAAAIPVLVVYTQIAGRFPSEVQYGTALYLGLTATFCLKPIWADGAGRRTAADLLLNLLLIAGATFAFAYFTREYAAIASAREGLPNRWDLWCYGVGALVVVAGAHRVEGWLLTSVVLMAFGYLLFGHVLPGILEHRPFPAMRVLEVSYGYRGIFGVALGSVVDIVLVFVLLGVALRVTGAGDLFNDLALMLTRGRRSGPAQCAVIASTLFGSINGSAPANVAATGVLTIPMMRRAGYSARFAGGVEATASCVGQIMPPVMGVGAFIMADVTGIPYVTIMLAALVPALLYILSISVTVALEAGRLGIRPLDAPPPPFDRRMASRAAVLVAGFGTLLALLFGGYPAPFAGLVATGVVVAVAMALPATRLKIADWPAFVVDSGRDGISVMLSCAAIGIVIAAITSTGLGIKLNQEITAFGGDSLIAALVLAALCSIVLGMGLPTAAAYLTVIFVAGPALMELGVSQLATHMFVFYYAVLSAITPPVALAVFAAASIAREKPLALAMTAMRLASVGFILPVAWIYHPEIMIGTEGTGVLDALAVLPMMVLAVAGLSAAQTGFLLRRLGAAERVVLAAAAAAVMMPALAWNLAGTGAILLVAARDFRGARRDGAA